MLLDDTDQFLDLLRGLFFPVILIERVEVNLEEEAQTLRDND